MASEGSPLLVPATDTAHSPQSEELAPEHSLDAESRSIDTSGVQDQQARTRDLLTVIPLLLLGVFICNGDTFLVVATNGAIASEFEDLGRSAWLLTSFMLTMCASQPLYGRLSDIFGRKLMLSAAYVLFIVGCTISGLGSTLNQVICGRGISGAGGAGMTALVSIIIADMASPRGVASWRSYVNVAATMGRSLGGPIGGYLTDSVGWRWAFLGQGPPLLFALALVLWRMPSSSPKSTATQRHDSSSSVPSRGYRLAQIDFLGATLLAGTIVSLLLALDQSSKRAGTVKIVLLALLTMVLGSCFILVEKRVARVPIFPVSLFGNRDVVTSYLIALLQITGQSGVVFTIPIYFQITDNATVAAAGFRLIPAVVGNALGGLVSGIVVKRTGKYKLLSIVGPAFSAIGFLLILLRWNGNTNLAELMYSIPGGFGSAVVQMTTFIQLTAGIDSSMMAIAGTSLYLCFNLGSVSGFSMATTIMQSALRVSLSRSLDDYPNSAEIIERSITNIHYIQSLEGKIRDLVIAAYLNSLGYTYACSILAAVVALFIHEHQM